MLYRHFAAQSSPSFVLLCSPLSAPLPWRSCSSANGQTTTTDCSTPGRGRRVDRRRRHAEHRAAGRSGRLEQTAKPGDGKDPRRSERSRGMRKISLQRLEAVLDDCVKNKKPIPDAATLSRRPATHPLCLCLSRAARHRAGRAGRGLEGRRQGERRRDHHRPAGDVAGRPAGGAADRQGGGPGRHHLLDRPDARRAGAYEAGVAATATRPATSSWSATASRRPWGCSRSACRACRRPAISPACWWRPTIA